MASTILMTPEDLRTSARAIDQDRSAVETTLNALDRTIQNVEQYWQGSAQCSFLQSYEDMKNQILSKFPGILEGISKQLTASAQVMEETDQKLADMFKG